MHTCFSEQSPEATRLGRGRAEGGAGSAHLARGGHREVEAVDGDADRNAHAREAQVALAQD